MTRSYIQEFLKAASGRKDLIIVLVMIVAISSMVLPITPGIADVLIAFNISISVLLLMVAFYIKSPSDFASLPSVILISTVFRLSISVATTRLILTEADAGAIVQTFGEFVISGNVIVGLVVFLIITIVQFLVITKGSERVAEVAARFSLDGLPGKQMSIDSDLRNGDIDQVEARRRRQMLEKDSQLYGAMDGALKFVKGDAIAGIIIIAVNLLGGIAVGTVQRGLSFSQATHIFSLLTIGDGLIAQIPALFVSMTAGTIVTRVSPDATSNLGSDIIAQLSAKPDAIRLAAIILFGLGLVPGFPTFVFFTLAAIFGLIGTMLLRGEQKFATAATRALTQTDTPQTAISALIPTQSVAPVAIAANEELFLVLQNPDMVQHLKGVCQALANDLGFACPSIGYRKDASMPNGRYAIEVDSMPEIARDVGENKVSLRSSASARLDELSIAYEKLAFTYDDINVRVGASDISALNSNTVKYFTTPDLIHMDTETVLRQNAANFLGLQETRRLLAALEGDYKDLLRETQRVAPIQRISEVLRRLLEEGVAIRNLRLILETMLEWAPREQDTNNLVNQVRFSLRRQICFRHADRDKVIYAILVERSAEDTLRAGIQQAVSQNQTAIDPKISNTFIESLSASLDKIDEEHRHKVVVLTAVDLRRIVWSLVIKTKRKVPILSTYDVAPDYSLKILETVRMAADGTTPSPASEGTRKSITKAA